MSLGTNNTNGLWTKLSALAYRFLLLRDPDRLLAPAGWICRNLPDQGLDQGVLVHVLGAEHHVLLGLAILASHRVENLLLI